MSWIHALTVQMFRTAVGHADGDLRLVHLLISDHALYMLSGMEKKSYKKKAAVDLREIDYIAVRYFRSFVCVCSWYAHEVCPDVEYSPTWQCTVWVKPPPPWGLVAIFPKRLGIFQPNFICLLCVSTYTRLQIFIQLPATLTNLCHIKRDHPVHIICAKCPPSAETHAGIFWHFSQTDRNF